MKIVQCESDRENAEKYTLDYAGRLIGYGYIINREINPIEIFVSEKQRSNGYGKLLFSVLLLIEKERGLKGMRFEIEDKNYRMGNIITMLGGEQYFTHDEVTGYILPIR